MKKSKTEIQELVVLDLLKERLRQDTKWGEQNHSFSLWNTILMEEVGEVSEEIIDFELAKKGNLVPLREELVQVAAVAVSILEYLDRTYTYGDNKPETNPLLKNFKVDLMWDDYDNKTTASFYYVNPTGERWCVYSDIDKLAPFFGCVYLDLDDFGDEHEIDYDGYHDFIQENVIPDNWFECMENCYEGDMAVEDAKELFESMGFGLVEVLPEDY
jgi:NTP pyrophosphatase (non-canonical NTP hydrolase)